MKTQTRKEKRKIAFWVSLDSQGIGLIGCSGEGLKLDRGKVRLGAELPTGARLGSSLSLSASCPGTWPPVDCSFGKWAHAFHTRPSSSSWHSFCFTFLLRVPAKSRGL